MGIESVKKYNKRVLKAIESFRANGETVAIVGKGRNAGEQSIVLVEKGNYLGFGFFGQDASIADFETARTYIRPGVETPTVQNLINSYLTNPRGAELIVF